MAVIVKNYKHSNVDYENVYFKLYRVFGSKREGWNGVFMFWPELVEQIEENAKGSLSLGIKYNTDELPYVALYNRLTEYLNEHGFNASSDEVKIEPVAEEIVKSEPVKAEKPKKTRKLKTKLLTEEIEE